MILNVFFLRPILQDTQVKIILPCHETLLSNYSYFQGNGSKIIHLSNKPTKPWSHLAGKHVFATSEILSLPQAKVIEGKGHRGRESKGNKQVKSGGNSLV